jgi:hypothetical protein
MPRYKNIRKPKIETKQEASSKPKTLEETSKLRKQIEHAQIEHAKQQLGSRLDMTAEEAIESIVKNEESLTWEDCADLDSPVTISNLKARNTLGRIDLLTGMAKSEELSVVLSKQFKEQKDINAALTLQLEDARENLRVEDLTVESLETALIEFSDENVRLENILQSIDSWLDERSTGLARIDENRTEEQKAKQQHDLINTVKDVFSELILAHADITLLKDQLKTHQTICEGGDLINEMLNKRIKNLENDNELIDAQKQARTLKKALKTIIKNKGVWRVGDLMDLNDLLKGLE